MFFILFTISVLDSLVSLTEFCTNFISPIRSVIELIILSNISLVSSTDLLCSTIIKLETSMDFITDSVLFLIPKTNALICFVADVESSANFLISSATIKNPFPDSPALATSMAAFRARRLVCYAI